MTEAAEHAGRALGAPHGLIMTDCAVSRGEASHLRPGGVEINESMEISRDDDQNLALFKINSQAVFTNSDDELLANVDVTFVCAYDVSDRPELDSAALSTFGDSVTRDARPFVREFYASMTNRLGVPVFYLPQMPPNEG